MRSEKPKGRPGGEGEAEALSADAFDLRCSEDQGIRDELLASERKLHERLMGVQPQLDALDRARAAALGRGSDSYRDLEKRLRAFGEDIEAYKQAFEPDLSAASMAASTAGGVRESEDLRFTLPKLPPNPIMETNKRLAQIEKRFAKANDLAVQASEIALSLQSYAADFLEQFKDAARENDRAASKAVKLGAMAVLVAVIIPIMQIGYTEFWRVPQDSAAVEASVERLRLQIQELSTMQAKASREEGRAVSAGNKRIVDALANIEAELERFIDPSVKGPSSRN